MQPVFANILRRDKRGAFHQAVRVFGGVSVAGRVVTFHTDETDDIRVGDGINLSGTTLEVARVEKRQEGPLKLIDVLLK